jgi:hypothetical protein
MSNRFMPRSEALALRPRALSEFNVKLEPKACHKCRLGDHDKCSGRRRLRLERRWAPCECAVCFSKKEQAQ